MTAIFYKQVRHNNWLKLEEGISKCVCQNSHQFHMVQNKLRLINYPIYHHIHMMQKKSENLELTARLVIKTSHSLKWSAKQKFDLIRDLLIEEWELYGWTKILKPINFVWNACISIGKKASEFKEFISYNDRWTILKRDTRFVRICNYTTIFASWIFCCHGNQENSKVELWLSP